MKRRHRVFLFAIACLLGGAGGVAGSAIGGVAGRTGLFAGGVAGGLMAAATCGIIARACGWIPAQRVRATGVGAALGFLAAALVATQTLGSPVGPVLSTTLIGLGAVAGASRSREDGRS